MGRQSGESTTKASSSIALLQERFRQLQKVKERREEKELMRMLSENERVSPSNNRPNMVYPHSNIRPTTSQDHPLSLGLDFQSKQGATRTARHVASRHDGAASASFDNSDIDTSLHL